MHRRDGSDNLRDLMSKRLMIGIDARAATEVPAGRGRVVRELLRALAERDDDVDYLLFARARWEDPLDDRFRWALIGSRDPAWHARVGRVATRRCDVFLATNSYLSVLLADMPCVLLVYDLAALDPATSPNRRSAVVERLTLTPAVRRATRLVCISQATADALHDLRPEVADQVLVAPLAASASPTAAPADELAALPAPGFVLAVGTLEPRKNLPRLVAAYSALSESLQTAHPLVVVGATGWRTGETLEALRSLGARCQMLGHVSDVALAELYRRCAVFCYPSLAEGFGLPVLEAMSAGAPVLTSSVSSLPEVGGDAAAYADPYDVTAIAQALRAILEDPTLRHALAAAGPPRAAQFSWDRFAGQVLGAIRDAAQSAPSTRR
jgi:glycosyltransferase involved in cell wall biosynthesis